MFCNDTATTKIYTYVYTPSLHAALPLWQKSWRLKPLPQGFWRPIGYPCVPFHRSRPMRRRIVAGNWKLHGSRAFATELLGGLAAGLPMAGVEVVVLPPLPYLGDLVEDFEEQGRLEFGSQYVSCNEKGAYPGECSVTMIADVGAQFGLGGHSE